MALVKAEEMSAGFTGLSGLHAFRQIGIMLGLAASVALGVTVVLWSWAPSFGVLYGALEEQDVSTVLDALHQNGFEAKLDQTTGAILVPTSSIHDARIKLSSMGLPKGVSAGFDALDDKNSFGISQFMEKARYQRALEIELARTISSLSNVKNARVHLAVPRQSVFVRNRKKASASVVINLYPGRSLEEGQVASIMHMISSSVPDLDTSKVTIVDQKGNLLTRGKSSQQMEKTGAQFEYASRLESSYIERIERLLTPILGSESIRAQVTANIDFTSSEQTQESFNPDTPALRSNQTMVEQSSGSISGGIPGALSNQPPGAVTAPELAGGAIEGEAAGPSSTHRKETKNYELDKTISHTRFSMGRLRRLSVAVVVDDSIITAADGSITRMQRTPEELDRLSNLVKQAVGFNAQRGDTLNIMNSSFIVPVSPEALPDMPIWEQGWVQDIAKKSLGALLVIMMLFGVLKPILKQLATQSKLVPAASLPADEQEVAEDMLTLAANKPPAPGSYEQNLLTASHAVEQDPKLVAQVVKNWVASDG